MAKFITSLKFTQQGIKQVGESTRRAAAFKAAAKKKGVKITDLYWTMGDHDGVIIFDAPDDETATAALLQLATLGNVHTSTSRAFTAAEMDAITAKM